MLFAGARLCFSSENRQSVDNRRPCWVQNSKNLGRLKHSIISIIWESLVTPTLPFLQNFSWDFIRMDTLNALAKFEICSFPRSWDNRGYPKNLGSPWIRPLSFFSMVPFKRAKVSSYGLAIVTFPVSVCVSEILPLLCSRAPFFPPHLYSLPQVIAKIKQGCRFFGTPCMYNFSILNGGRQCESNNEFKGNK